MSNDLKINIIAQDNTGPAVKSVEQGVISATQETDRLIDKIKSIKTAAEQGSTGMKSIADGAVTAQAATDRLTASMNKGIGTSLQNLQNMGRIIQDMPYGIQGIGNNIQPMVESFSRAKAEAGSTGAAIKMLLQSIAGPTGLAMIGIPVVTSLAIAFGPDLIKSIGGSKSEVDKLKDTLKSLGDYKNFDLEIKIKGLEGIKALEARLQAAIDKKSYLEGTIAVDQAVKSNTPSFWQKTQNIAKYGRAYTEEYYNAEGAQKHFYKLAAKDVLEGRKSLGEEENIRLLKEYYGMDESSARTLLARHEASYDVNMAKADVTKGMAKDASKSGREEDAALRRALADAEKSVAAWEAAIKRADEMLLKGEKTALDYATAQSEVEKAEQSVIDIRALGPGHTAELVKAEDELAKANIRLQNATTASTKKIREMQDAFKSIGDVVTNLGGNGQGVASLLSGMTLLSGSNVKKLADERYGGDTAKAKAAIYSQIGQAVGSVTGSNAITNAATLAGAGFTIGGPIGAGVGGVIGLVSSLFGGGASAQDVSTAQAASSSGWKSIDELAASGSPIARAMMRRVGYSASSAAVNAREASFYGMGFDNLLGGTRDFGMFYTKENGYNSDVIAYLTNLEKVDSVMRAFTSTTTAQKIDELNWKFEELIGQQSVLANAEQVRLTALTAQVLGINADSVATFISDAVGANVTGKAGAAFSAKFEESIATAIRNMAVSNLVTNSIMPVLQPVMAQITTGLLSGTLSTSEMGDLMKQAAGVSKTISPMVTGLAQAFAKAGLLTTTNSTLPSAPVTSSAIYGSKIESLRAKYGIPAFADGGIHSGGWRIVGENGPELEYTGPSRIYPNSTLRSGMASSDSVAREIQALREEMKAGMIAVAANTSRTAKILNQWDGDGQPATREY